MFEIFEVHEREKKINRSRTGKVRSEQFGYCRVVSKGRIYLRLYHTLIF